ncbi:4-hydroxythreonine-4-phosphate dehydrogenase [Chloroherpeton thalassium ATCC 35110]|uniref:4-hydroxythreonine-4-phosphate dehydrogenase n=1 Tax=Chloroherpeton thalassium (strain ATCC 35110 / GB-78) TaxID=517418 RepID=B3QV85_CHLT3|nr:4-hydroxythreonine-4-phosphate dehydrogenase PdxA [Chloroherpeton thalassium]ACF13039.1 4-hydroxythreonine-4-phosphate dehydrogenase [Chloroherpeton thalassium ATCC 35110]
MTILWTIGDINGIGPEIILKSFMKLERGEQFVVVGSFKVLQHYVDVLSLPVQLKRIKNIEAISTMDAAQKVLPVLDVGKSIRLTQGKVSASAGELAMMAIERATTLCLMKRADAMVTAPIHKEAISKAGYSFSGHTDYITYLCGSDFSQMMLCDRQSKLKVVLATVHVPVSKVSALVRQDGIEKSIVAMAESLAKDFAVQDPRIAVLALNPHASDGGVIGNEEQLTLEPQIKKLQKNYRVEGPFASDGFFGTASYNAFDAVLAMYHDQGLIPFKMLAFETGVNVTMGLPIVRTSPDHGTAFDIAGKGIASEASFIEATLMACEIARARQMQNEEGQ